MLGPIRMNSASTFALILLTRTRAIPARALRAVLGVLAAGRERGPVEDLLAAPLLKLRPGWRPQPGCRQRARGAAGEVEGRRGAEIRGVVTKRVVLTMAEGRSGGLSNRVSTCS